MPIKSKIQEIRAMGAARNQVVPRGQSYALRRIDSTSEKAGFQPVTLPE
jgi:hypothetical protein